ncbi:MAG: glucose 1-dehydrogenase [Bacillati bacterium ANGP1]|uniref:Glucose 1-dehydrogenase n=1 Tax=Candidatus Segetimicrobium genomatis TaxID=2569760 RepID=A0A537K752_9BACT|nr:MAG: glucose 1-dehydrogenase [Terrabacteria group bacterium ANGP1]
MRRLTGKVALVTGAGRGIGRAIAKALAQEGASLVLHHLESAQGAAEAAEAAGRLGVPTLVARADVSLAAAVRNMFEEIHRTFGRLDILVNNAGVFSRVPLLEVAEAHWDRVLDVNLKGTFLCAQAAARVMLAQQSGVIVNLASGGGLSPRPGYETSAPYAASKAGVIMLTRRLALELAPHVRVNAVAPGIVESRPGWSEDVRKRLGAVSLLRRVGTPEAVANAVVFLVSDDAATITGHTLVVDGGTVLR